MLTDEEKNKFNDWYYNRSSLPEADVTELVEAFENGANLYKLPLEDWKEAHANIVEEVKRLDDTVWDLRREYEGTGETKIDDTNDTLVNETT